MLYTSVQNEITEKFKVTNMHTLNGIRKSVTYEVQKYFTRGVIFLPKVVPGYHHKCEKLNFTNSQTCAHLYSGN